jgi:hypothetical protein
MLRGKRLFEDEERTLKEGRRKKREMREEI